MMVLDLGEKAELLTVQDVKEILEVMLPKRVIKERKWLTGQCLRAMQSASVISKASEASVSAVALCVSFGECSSSEYPYFRIHYIFYKT